MSKDMDTCCQGEKKMKEACSEENKSVKCGFIISFYSYYELLNFIPRLGCKHFTLLHEMNSINWM